MFPLTIISNTNINVEPSFGKIVFKLSLEQDQITDAGPHNLEIKNPSNLKVQEDVYGKYINFQKLGANSFLQFNHNSLFDYRNCEIEIKCSSSVFKDAALNNLNTIFDCSNGLAVSGVTIGTIGSQYGTLSVSAYGASRYYLSQVLPKDYTDVVKVVMRYDLKEGSSVMVIGSNNPSQAKYIPIDINKINTVLGALGGGYLNDARYQIKGKIYSVIIREKE